MKLQGFRFLFLFWGFFALPILGANFSPFQVKPGDTLYSISKQHKTSVAELLNANPGLSPENLKPGQILKIPNALIEKQKPPSSLTSTSSSPSASSSSSHPNPNLSHPLNRPNITPKKQFSALTYAPHKGVLYPASDATPNAHSVQSGKVVTIDYMDGYGNYLILEHPNKMYSLYANLEKIHVVEGQSVQKKDKIASIQRDKGLYFQWNQKEKPIPPASFHD